MKYLICTLVFLMAVSTLGADRKATDFPGTYSSYDDPGDALYHNFHHRFHISRRPSNLVKTISGITSSQFSLNLDWDNDDANMMAQLFGSQGVWWCQDFPSFSVHTLDRQTWFTADSTRVIDFTEKPPLGANDSTKNSHWIDTLVNETNYDLEPGLPYKGYIVLQYFNDPTWIPFYPDSFFTVRIPNTWANNLYTTSEVATDSFNLWDNPQNLGYFNPTQEDSLVITTGDTMHVIQPTYSTGDCLIDCEGADFDSDYDTTFAHITINSGGVLKMHGGTRINVLAVDNKGTITMTATDTIAVAHGVGWIYYVGSFTGAKKMRAVNLRGIDL